MYLRLCDVGSTYICIHIYLHFCRDTVLSKNSFLKPELRPNVFTDPVVTDLLFRWVGRRKGEIQRHWRQLGPCVCRLVWHLNTNNTHIYTHSDLFLFRHTISLNFIHFHRLCLWPYSIYQTLHSLYKQNTKQNNKI